MRASRRLEPRPTDTTRPRSARELSEGERRALLIPCVSLLSLLRVSSLMYMHEFEHYTVSAPRGQTRLLRHRDTPSPPYPGVQV